MDPESQKLLEDTHRLAEENNDMLRSLKRSMRLARIMSVIYWVFIIGSAVGAYYLIQPYLDSLTETYDSAKSTFDSIKNFGR